MRFKHKKLFISGTAVAAAGALGVGAFLQTVLSVQASSDMMPGIEQIVSENTEEEPFKILELVNNSEDAEIGYYISGQEPTLKLYEYQYTDQSGNEQKVHFSSVQEALSKLPEKYRTEFMMNVKVNDDGIIDSDSSTGIKKVGAVTGDNSSEYPLSYSDYKEKYFLESGDDADSWNKIDMVDFEGKSRTDTVQVNGSYQANTSGTGNYTKADQEYYPIRNDVDSDKNQPEKFRENIQSFYPSEGSDSRGAYYLEFAEVSNDKINSALEDENKKKNEILPEYDYANGRYGYYENVYTDLTKEITDNINSGNYQFAGENPDAVAEGAVEIQKNENEAVQSNISESNAFSSGEDNNSATVDSSSDGQDDFSVDEGTDSGSVDFDNAYPSDEFDNGDLDGGSFDSDISLEQQSYEVPADSSDTDVFSDDFSNQTVISDDSGNMADAQTSDEQDTSAFDEDGTDAETADPTGEDVDEQSDQRIAIGRIDNDSTAGSQGNPYIYLGKNIDEYPYYQYELIGDLEYVQNKIGEVENEVKNDPDRGYIAGDIILENDQYWYYGSDENGTVRKYPLSIVTGRQPVSYNELQTIPTDKIKYNYYYRVEKVYFCCKSVDNSQEDPSTCAYFGWYYPTYPANEDEYLPVTDGKAATHYISAASYSLTPGKGNYDFVPGGENSCHVEVNSFYYQGGYTNNDWFKKYVFHLSPKASEEEEDGEFENFGIEVDTKSAENATELVYAPAVTGEDTAAQRVSADDEAVSINAEGTDAESAAETQQNDASDEVEFTSEYQEADTQEAGETAEAVGDNDEAVVTDENSDETSVDAEVDETTEDEADVATEENTASDAGDGESTDTLSDSLKEYDLIYLNGKPAQAVAEAIIASGVPCIVNAEKTSDDNVFETAFSSVINSTDADGHYVNTNVYFFKNNSFSDETDTADLSNLVNKNFYKNFNSHIDSEEDTTYGGTDTVAGFEEIIKYINSENKYRKLLADSSSDDFSSGDSEQTQGASLLSREISQARAIEYIINYKYKRAISKKSKVNVLEITPDKIKGKLSENDVKDWIIGDEKIDSIVPCCEEEKGDAGDKDRTFVEANMRDGDSDTFWHTQWSGKKKTDHPETTAGRYHSVKNPPYIDITFKNPEALNGFIYQARPWSNDKGHRNGVLSKYTVVFYDVNGKQIGDSVTGETGLVDSKGQQDEAKTISFGKTISSVKRMRLIFTETWSSSDYSETAIFGSCAELGVVYADGSEDQDLKVTVKKMTAAEFVGHIDDLGSEYDMIYISGEKPSDADNLITGSGNLRYTHVGSGLQLKWISNNNIQNTNLRKLLGILDIDYYRNSDGTRWHGDIWNEFYSKVPGYRFAPFSQYNENGAGYFRGSGNDMTKQQYNELMDFVKSGYPVVIGNALMKNNAVDTSKVGASSWYYQFITDALKYDNVMSEKQARSNHTLSFYTNLSKPRIEFSEKPLEVVRASGTDDETNTEDDGKQGYIEDSQLKYVFKITDDSDIAPASASYDCRLYIDLNFDGNMSENENQKKYIQIQDETGNVLSRNANDCYELKLGKQYTLIRKLPSDYYKVMNWKLVVSSNRNSYVHVSETGYAKQQKIGSPQMINVLQLVPDSKQENGQTKENPCTWNLAEDARNDTTFRKLLAKVTDFSLNIQELRVSDIKNMSYTDMQNKLNDQQMLIIGFADVYQDIPNNNKQVQAILEYIQSGRSVIFSHDTTSYVNYNRKEMNREIGSYTDNDDKKMYVFDDEYLNRQTVKNVTWGLSLNSVLRAVVGMDRYGVTSEDSINTASYGKITVGELTRKGINLTEDTVSLTTLMDLAGDVAYKDNSKTETYVQTQGYSNGIIEDKTGTNTITATKVNEGAITEYPFKLDDIDVSKTHGQYYQLAMERDDDKDGCNDVVVWYCLKGSTDINGNNYNGENGYSQSPNDVRNNYYFYSKGNVIYTGAGHSKVNQEDEIKLFINAIVAAANVSAVDPDVNFVSELNPAAQVETSRYYMTDQSNWATDSADQGNVLEKDMQFYLNVKDYNMVSASLGSEDEGTEDMNVQFFIDTSGTQSGTPDESRLTSIMKEIDGLTTYGTGTVIGKSGVGFSVGNNAYAFTVNNIEQYLKDGTGGYKQNCKIYAKVTSNVTLYGKKYTKTKWASIDLKQRQLFEMD